MAIVQRSTEKGPESGESCIALLLSGTTQMARLPPAAVRRCLASKFGGSVTCEVHGANLEVVVSGVEIEPAGMALHSAATAARALLGPYVGGLPCWLGVGTGSATDVAAAVETATATVRMARSLGIEPRLIHHDDIWILEGLIQSERAARLERIIAPLVAHDDGSDTDLLGTLSVYFASALSVTLTARRLGIHRHTVADRLNRVESMLGRSLRSRPDRLVLELAVCARAFGQSQESVGGI